MRRRTKLVKRSHSGSDRCGKRLSGIDSVSEVLQSTSCIVYGCSSDLSQHSLAIWIQPFLGLY